MTPLDDRTGIGTRQRREVYRALRELRGFVSARTLYYALCSAGAKISLATVYRALYAFAASGRAETMWSHTGAQLFSATTSDGRQYRLVCQACQKRVLVELKFVEDWAAMVAAEHDYSDVHLIVEITGRCTECAAATSQAANRSCTQRRTDADLPPHLR